ncbi:protein kinase domain-containing protein [Nocardioides zeae]|uniref:non-specific serine/threonine protein kinase n=1 Tax=Nocardioides zeae TaxID=1457234 RepID=A0AAJ1X286_9ACTN|nr:protein kinase [Nocardioides zeae]MDQ1103312.1 ABC-type branched-subunit amino acid transport system substrate-binding protein [Nocardioides zeae]
MLPQPGAEFGSYDVGERIGRGGMGVVYRAVHRDLQREVALKVLSEQFSSDAEYRARFLSEARTLARLESPFVVTIHDAGERDSSLFLAMQLVPDGDLAAWLRQYGAVPPAMALDLLRQVTSGLLAAHEAGVLHRDIKASNVLLRRLGEGGVRAYLCDFGIAQTEDAGHTRTGGVVGTWAYLAPERHRGVPASVRSDLYALGCLLWVMLTGRTPYEAASEMEVALAHMNAPVPQLPEHGPQERGINDLLRQLMAKDPGQRPASARALLPMLDRVSRGTGGPGPAPGRRAVAEAPPSAPAPAGRVASGDLPTHGRRRAEPGPASTPARGERRTTSGTGRGRWLLAAGLAGVVLVAGAVVGVLVLGGDDPEGGDGTVPLADVPFADDDQPGVVDADYTVTPCGDAGTATDALRVGGLLPLRSDDSTYRGPTTAGLGLAVSDINAAGGVLGQPVCQAVEEAGDRLDLESGEEGAAALIDQDMSVVVGPTRSEVAEAVVPEFRDAEVPLVGVGATDSELSGISPYFFRTIGDTTAYDDAFARLAQENSADTIAFVAQQGAADQIEDRDRLLDAAEAAGSTCVWGCDDTELTTDADFSDDAAAVVASGAETVVVLTEPTSPFMDAYAPAKTDANVVTVGGSFQLAVDGYPAFFGTVSALVNGARPGDGFVQRLGDWTAATDEPDLTISTLAAETYDAVVLAALAAVRGEATDGATIAENLRAVAGSGGGTVCVTFRRCAALLEGGHEVTYRGVAVDASIDADNDLESGRFSVLGYDESGEIITDPVDEIVGTKSGADDAS